MNLLKNFRASNSHRVLSCTQSIKCNNDNTTNSFSIRGIAIHSEVEKRLKNKKRNDYFIGDNNNYYFFDNNDEFLLNNYINYLNNFNLFNGYGEVEKRVKLKYLHAGLNNKHGYIDYFYYDTDNNILDVIDLKTGFSKVDIENNTQLSIYAYCLIKELKIKPQIIKLTIYQYNRDYTSFISYNDLLELINNMQGILDIFKSVTPANIDNLLIYNPSDSNCKYCTCKNTCQFAIKSTKNKKNIQ